VETVMSTKLAEENRQTVIRLMKAMHNHIGITGDCELCRVVGFYEDEMDYYWEVTNIEGENVFHTACGHFVSLKGVLPEEHYTRIDNFFTLNGAGPTKIFHIYTEEEQ